MYKDIVKNSSTLLKVYKTIKCILRVVSKVTRYKNETVLLGQEAFYTLIRSSQRLFPVDLKNKVHVNDIDVLAPRLTRPGSECLFGTSHLPVISYRDPIAMFFL